MSLLPRLDGAGRLVRRLATTRHAIRHRAVVATAGRRNAFSTSFLRCPHQYEVLTGPVLRYLKAGAKHPLRIVEFGCSSGAETYSVAVELIRADTALDFKVHAFDIEEWVLAIARNGCYTKEQVFRNRLVEQEFVDRLLVRRGDQYCVRPEIARHVRFDLMDVRELESAELERADIVIAQNFLYHLNPNAARDSFGQLYRLLKPRGALLVDGMDLGMKVKLVRQYGLHAVDHLIREVHEDARVERGRNWPDEYWGLEPFSTLQMHWKERYATVFTTTPCPVPQAH